METTGKNLIFAGGVPRSGLTLLRAIANAHPDILCGPESGITPTLPMQWRLIANQLGDLHNRDFGLTPEIVRHNFAQAIERLYSHSLTERRNTHILEKNPLNVLAFDPLSQIFPEAKFIHVVRDARDVVTSLLERDWRDPQSGVLFPHVRDARAAAAYWAGMAQVGMQAERIIDDKNRFHVLYYEDLAAQPKRTLSELFEFLGLSFREEVLLFYKYEMPLYGIENESEELLRQPIAPDRVGRWRNQLSPEQQEDVMAVAGPLIKAFGYR